MKQTTPDAHGEARIAFEAKLKAGVRGNAHEIVVKQDGTATWEMKGNDLQKRVQGLQYILYTSAQALPTT